MESYVISSKGQPHIKRLVSLTMSFRAKRSAVDKSGCRAISIVPGTGIELRESGIERRLKEIFLEFARHFV
jgi:hypothetical protein